MTLNSPVSEMQISDIPAMPLVATKAMSLLAQENVQQSDLARVLEADVAIAARILRVANSPVYGFLRKIATLREALPLLGLAAIKGMVITVAMRNLYKNPGLMENLLWQHSIGTGLAARFLAYRVGGCDADLAFMGGLLHDVGKNVIYNQQRLKYLKFYQTAYNDNLSGKDYVEGEVAAFGFSHLHVGERVAEKWNLSEDLTECLTKHHVPDDEFLHAAREPRLLAIVAEANLMSHFLGIGVREAESETPLMENPAARFLNLKVSLMQNWIDQFDDIFEKQKESFHFD